jgi:hypothetical protein
LKSSAGIKTVNLLHTLDIQIRKEGDILSLLGGSASKITKGENLKGFPYFVLDAPKLAEENSILAIRVIVWWGNYISANLLLGGNILDRFREKIIKNLPVIHLNDLYFSTAENLWQHDVYDDNHYIKGQDITKDKIEGSRSFKISQVHELNTVNINESLLSSVKILNSILL